MQKLFTGDIAYYVKILPKMTDPLQNANFQSIFACTTSAMTPSEKVQLTQIGSPPRAFQ